ncbi:EmrB/QacA subfamily drug resistance transporter [Actinoplanes tereljensis]|uniref:Major facilitator superfamily (MFS) profile domain-containing protein n=1 Tax=Paractinoplanes tereljensis TaxID=571912 RepID=A0A919NG12_9ACTN|nr:MFS transporter [Actinoplanes tereljensis]GIF17783.1 hypothetical protein Ate02nite_05130 [Actinoplanes tereljensis]
MADGTATSWQTDTAPPDPRRWYALAAVLAGALIILIDSTIVNVAIPPLQRDLEASYDSAEWVITGYALAYGLLLIPGGRLGDRFGYKKLFLLSLAGFTITSALCGLAQGPVSLIVWRVLQGAMAGLMNPQILAVIQVAFPMKERGRAYGLYGAVSGVAVALGPLLGGLLIDWNVQDLGWRPIFLINVPLGIITAVMAAAWLREARGRGGSLDPIGILLIGSAIFLLSFPLVEGRAAGWPLWSWLMLAASVPMFALFVIFERSRTRRGREPLIDLNLFRGRTFSAGIGIGFAYFAGFISLWFVLSLYLQLGLARSALYAGLVLLPFAVGSFAGGLFSDWFSSRMGRWVIALGAGLVSAGIIGLIVTIDQVGADVSGWALVPSLLVSGLGSGLVISPNVDIVLSGVQWKDAGAASGVLNTAQRLGMALGLAVVGVAFFGALGNHAAASAEQVTPQLQQQLVAAGLSPDEAQQSVDQFQRCFVDRGNADDPTAVPASCPQAEPGPVGAAFTEAADAAVADNFTHAVLVGAAYSLGAVVLSLLLVFVLPKPQPQSWGGDSSAGEGSWGGDGDSDSNGGGDWSDAKSTTEWSKTDNKT